MNRILDDLLRPGARLPRVYQSTVYLYDDATKRLIPAYPKEPADAFALRCFEPGKGATGYLFALAQLGDHNATVVVTDDAVSDDTYGLTPGQQQFYAGFRAVAAVPIWIDLSQPAGVLTAISHINDGFFDVDQNRLALRRLARVVGEVLYATMNPEELI